MSKTKKQTPKKTSTRQSKAAILQADPSAHVTGKLQPLSLKLIDPSKTNPRKHFDEAALKDLAESIAKRGVLSPIIVRSKGDRYELVAGERRFRASKLAKLDEIPAMVCKLDDKAVLEVQVIENLQRTDLSAIEEADSYSKLVKSHGYTVEVLASKIGKSQSYVHKRMMLASLSKKIRDAVTSEQLPIVHAVLLARIPEESLQLEAFKEFTRWNGHLEPLKECQRLVADKYMRRLSAAPFDVNSLTVLPSAGACSTCEFRTGNQKELFDDVKATDICTKPSCYGDKTAAWWKNSETPEEKLPIDSKIFAKYSPGSLDSGSKYIDLRERCWEAKGSKTYQGLVGKTIKVFLALDTENTVHRLALKKDVEVALKGHPAMERPMRDSSGNPWRKDEKLRKERVAVAREVKKRLRELLLGAWVNKHNKISTEQRLRYILRAWLLADHSGADDFLKWRGGLDKLNYENRGKEIAKFVEKSSEIELWCDLTMYVVHKFVNREEYQMHGSEKLFTEELAKIFDIDSKAIEAEVKKERAEVKKLKKAKLRAKGKKAPKSNAAPKAELVAESEDDFEDVDEEIDELEEVEE